MLGDGQYSSDVGSWVRSAEDEDEDEQESGVGIELQHEIAKKWGSASWDGYEYI